MKFFTWLAAQIEWLKSFLQEESGKASMKRLIQFIIATTFLRAYFRISILNEEIVDVPENWMWLLMATIGLGIAANYFEKKDPNVPKLSIADKIKNVLSKKEETQDV